MALKLDSIDARGVKVRYHRIVAASAMWPPDKTPPTLTVGLRSYVNKELRDRETKGAATAIRTVAVEVPMLDTITLPALYQAVKALPEWAGAEDC